MLYSHYILRDGVTRLRNLTRQLKEGSDVEQYKSKVSAIMIDIIFALEENGFCMKYPMNYINARQTTLSTLRQVRSLEEAEVIKTTMEEFIENTFQENNNLISDSKDIYDYRDTVYQLITSTSNSITQDNIAKLASCISANRKLNLLDPRCATGDLLNKFRGALEIEADTYGIDEGQGNAVAARKILTRVALGSLAGSRISNDTFDVMISELPITWKVNAIGLTTFSKKEKSFIHNTMKYVRPDGVVILILPYFRLYKDMCLAISKALDNIQIRRITAPSYNDKGLIAEIGTKSSKKLPDEDSFRAMRRLYDPNNLVDLVSTNIDTIKLPNDFIKVEFFRGSVLDMDEMAHIINNSGAVDEFFEKQKVQKISDNQKNPLLPFNIGQIGLVLTSGCLDGIVHEDENHCHLIKGRVSKKSDVDKDVNDEGHMERNETISNRVEINIFMPNGEYKTLA
jgi:hypothetical protein